MHEVDIFPVAAYPVELNLESVGGVAARAAYGAATSQAFAPTVTAVRSPTVAAPVATGDSSALAPLAGGSEAAFVSPPVASAVSAAIRPAAEGSLVVFAPVAIASSTAIGLVTPVNAGAVAPLPTAAGVAVAPTIEGEAVLTGGGPGNSSRLAYPPVVTGASGGGPAAPQFDAVGAALVGSGSTTANVPVPAGMALNKVVFVYLYVEDGTQAVTLPSGFAEAGSSPVLNTNPGTEHRLRVYWKRATGADSGTYNFTVAAGVAWRMAYAVSYSGCVTSGNPLDVTTSAQGNTDLTAVSMTTTVANTLLIWSAASFSVRSYTPPTGFTERADINSGGGLTVADMAQASAGATGSVQGTQSSAAVHVVWMGALRG